MLQRLREVDKHELMESIKDVGAWGSLLFIVFMLSAIGG
jgi:hypothetical protein